VADAVNTQPLLVIADADRTPMTVCAPVSATPAKVRAEWNARTATTLRPTTTEPVAPKLVSATAPELVTWTELVETAVITEVALLPALEKPAVTMLCPTLNCPKAPIPVITAWLATPPIVAAAVID